MAKLAKVLGAIEKQQKSKSTTNNKQRWREIEQLREKFQLEKDLKSYDYSLEYMLDEF